MRVMATTKVEGTDLPPSREEMNITPPVVIVEFCVSVPHLKAHMVVFSLSQILVLLTEEAAGGTSTKADPMEFNDTFSQVVRGCSPFDFLILSEGKQELMEAMVGGKIGLMKAGLEVVRTLKRVLTSRQTSR